MAEHFYQKEIGGMPVWVWGAGALIGLYITGGLSFLFGKKTATSGTAQSVLPAIQGSIGNESAGNPTPSPTQPAPPAPTPPAPVTPQPTCYTVQSGDSLSSIASSFSTPGGYPQLVIWNSVPNACGPGYPQLIVNPNLIYAGWKLRVK